MKDKIIIFIIGLLVGAVITASGFLVYEKINQNNNQTSSVEEMRMMERPDGETPPEKPSGMESNEDRPEPPSKNNSNTNNKSN